jgi:hypothetical protein
MSSRCKKTGVALIMSAVALVSNGAGARDSYTYEQVKRDPGLLGKCLESSRELGEHGLLPVERDVITLSKGLKQCQSQDDPSCKFSYDKCQTELQWVQDAMFVERFSKEKSKNSGPLVSLGGWDLFAASNVIALQHTEGSYERIKTATNNKPCLAERQTK